MKNITIAYHIYLSGENASSMVVEQLNTLLNSVVPVSSYIYVGITLDPMYDGGKTIKYIANFFKVNKLSKKVEIVVYEKNEEETETLKWVATRAAKFPQEYICYLHTKGVTKQNQATEDWRHYMEYFVIENWQNCIKKLEQGFDCCGVMWNDTKLQNPKGLNKCSHYLHFSGNFWWASSAYINTLDFEYLELDWRFYREFWIGSAECVKAFEFHNSTLNNPENLKKGGHYKFLYPRGLYSVNTEIRLRVICTCFQRPIEFRYIIDVFLLQSDSRWVLELVHDGKPSVEILKYIATINDDRIHLTYTEKVNGKWGHVNRGLMLDSLKGGEQDFVLITNEDNYYVPQFVEYCLTEIQKGKNVGMVFCNTVHSYMKYEVHVSQLKKNRIDMGAFIVKLDVAQRVGFNNYEFNADGIFAEKCKRECEQNSYSITHINKPLFIHN